MPIYEYVCRTCGEPLEKLQKLSDPPLTDCPACGESTLKRKVSAAGFRLAGGGWYETDFKADGRRNVAASGDTDSASNDAANSGSGDKSATGAEKKSGAEGAGSNDKSGGGESTSGGGGRSQSAGSSGD